ncbi:GEM-like protein 1 [Abrus precatorius]|uniref:GEM-like protein 1 n=1 Tax=Abrus precatorius TaxID=3816 RepID=A0A8B8MIK2_ABRPR|nr:GEM-like protein 1 [Abrus precatorius]
MSQQEQRSNNTSAMSAPTSENIRLTRFWFCWGYLDSVKDGLGKWGKKAVQATKNVRDLAANMWHHLKTGSSFADTAVERIAMGTRVIAEGGHEKIFKQSFETVSEEKLLKAYACYLSTSTGPVVGVLYLSTVKLAFCSDYPLSYEMGEHTQWTYYKVVLPLLQLRAVNPLTIGTTSSEKYIQIITVDNYEFWFMAFVHYNNAVTSIQGALQCR